LRLRSSLCRASFAVTATPRDTGSIAREFTAEAAPETPRPALLEYSFTRAAKRSLVL
jgi:hypothetical protein